MGTERSSSLRKAARLFIVASGFVVSSMLLATCDLFKVGLGSKVDIEPPVISISSPAPNYYTGGEIPVAGTVADDTGLSTVKLNVIAEGTVVQSVSAAVSGGTWTALIDSATISDGNRRLLAVATDTAGKRAETSLDINIDNSAPVVLVSVPQTEAADVYNTRISFRGTVYDASPVQSTVVQLLNADGSVKASKASTNASNWSVSFTIPDEAALGNQAYGYFVESTDKAGNQNTHYYHAQTVASLIGAVATEDIVGPVDQGVAGATLPGGKTRDELVASSFMADSPASFTIDQDTDKPVFSISVPGAGAVLGQGSSAYGTVTDDDAVDRASIIGKIYNSSSAWIADIPALTSGSDGLAAYSFELPFETGGGSALADGSYSIVFQAEDTGGVSNSYGPIAFTIDGSIPVISDILPGGNYISNGAAVEVSAAVSDDNDVVSVRMSADGETSWSAATESSGRWTANVDTSAVIGGVELLIEATDGSGKQARVRKNFQIDTIDPLVSIILPADIDATQNGIFKVNGSSYDDNGIASTRYKLGAGAWTEATPSAQSWSITVDSRGPVPASGDLPLAIETRDNSNRVLAANYLLHIDQALDPASLSFLNLDPSAANAAAGLALNQLGSLAALSGRVEDDDAIATIEAWIDGSPVTPTLGGSVTSKSFSISLLGLAAGSHTIRLRAADDAAVKLGAPAAQTDSGNIYFVIDRSAPSVPATGLLPASNSYSNQTNYSISGEAEDDWGLAAVELSINGSAYAPATLGAESLVGGLWKRSWNFAVSGDTEGVKTVRIRATDKAGKTYERELVFTIDSSPPTVVYNDPRPAVDVGGSLKVNGVVTVSASIVDDYPIASARYRIDGGSWTATTANLAKQGISFDTEPHVGTTGTILFEFSAFDPAGNETLESQSLSVDQSSDAPRVALSNLDGSINNAGAALPNLLESNPKITGNFEDDDGIDASTIQISLNGGSFSDVTQKGASGPSVAFEHSLSALPEGLHYFSLKATDLASAKAGKPVKSATIGPVYFYIDKAAPSVAVSGPANGAQKNADFAITGTASDANGLSGDIVVKKDGVQVATLTPVGGNWSYNVLANPDHSGDGNFAYEFVASDRFNKQGSASLSVLVDTLPPAPAISAPAAASWNSGSTLSASGTVVELNTLAAVEWSLDGTNYTPVSGTTPWTASIPTAALGEGAGKTLYLRARDGAGNLGTSTRLFGIDQNPPTTSVTAPASANAAFAIIGDASDGNALASVRIVQRKDGVAASDTTVLDLSSINSATRAWSTGASLPAGGLSTGTYAYTITVTDVAGRTYSPTVATVTIDLDPPSSAIADPAPADLVFGAAYTLRGTASDTGPSGLDRIEYSLDGWATTSTASGAGSWSATIADLAALGEGAKTLLVRAVDKAGNVQNPVSSVNFTIDQSPPSISSAFPTSSYARSTATISGAASDTNALASVTATRSKDGGAPVAQALTGSGSWSISLDPAVVGEGTHVLTITALDAANRTTTIERTVVVDTTEPSASFSSVSPLVGTKTVNGTISFTASASDSNGLAGVRWKVLPDAAADPTYETAPNSWAASPYTASLDTTSLTDATDFNLWIIARDRAGNDSAVAYPIHVLQASDKPVFALTNMDAANDTAPEAAGNLQETNAKLSATVTDDDGVNGATLKIAIDGGAAAAVSSKVASGKGYSFEHNLSALGEGVHYFSLEAADINGSAVVFGPVYFTVDKFSASVAVASPLEGSRHKGNFAIAGTASDFNGLSAISATRTKDGSTVAQALGGSLTSWSIAVDVDTDGAGPDTGLGDGNYSYSITATDNFGKSGSATINLVVDTTAPVISITAPLAASWNRGATLGATGTVSEANGIASVQWSTDGSSWNAANGTADWDALVSLSGLGEGAGKTLYIRSTDLAGNVGSLTRLFGIDQADPATTVSAPSSAAALFAISGNASDGNSLASIVVTQVKDGGAAVEAYRLDAIGASGSAWSTGASLPSTGLASGTYAYSIRVTDAAGNAKDYPDVATVSIDLEAPTTSVSDPLAAATLFGNSYTIRGTASDSGPSGLDEVLYSLDGGSTWALATGTGSWSATLNLLALGEGSFSLQVKALDKAGNEQAVATTRAFFIDQANPSLGSSAALTQNSSGAVTISGTASDSNGLRTWDHDANGGTAELPYVEVSANGGAAFKANVDTGDGSWSFLVDPDTDGAGPDTGYAEGSWLFQITATDAANRSVHIDRTVVLDLSAPTIAIGTPGAGAVLPSAALTIAGTASDGVGVGVSAVYYSLDFSDDGNFANETWTLASGSSVWNASLDLGAEGPKTLSIRARDGLGQYSAVSSVSFDLDLTPPTLGETGVGTGTQRRSSDFLLSGLAFDTNGLKTWDDPSDGSALLVPYVTVSVNGGAASKVSVDADGADDVAGNADDNSWSYSQLVNPDGSEDGEFSFTIVATDIVDKPTTLTRLVTVDTTAPAIVVEGIVSGLNSATGTVNRLIGIRFGASDSGVGIAKSGANYLAYYTVVGDGVVPAQTPADIAAWTPLSSASSNYSLSYDTSAVALGDRDLYIGVLDAVTGAPNGAAAKVDLSIDQSSNLPRLAFDNLDDEATLNGENGLGQSPSILVTIEDDDAVDVSALRYRIDANNDGAFAGIFELGTAGDKWENEAVWYAFSEIPATDRSLAQGKILLTDFPQGLYGIQIEASDAIGGANSVTQSGIIPFAVDYGPPKLTVTSPVSGTFRSAMTLTLTATDTLGVATVKYSLDNGVSYTTVYPGPSDTDVSYSGGIDIDALATGEYALQIVATDVGGYAATQQIPITIDKTKPTVTFLQPAPAGSTINGNQVTVSGEAQDNRLIGSVFLWHGLASVNQATLTLPSRTGSGPDDYAAGSYTRLVGKGVWSLDIDTSSVALTGDNGYRVRVVAIDDIGNVGDPTDLLLKVDQNDDRPSILFANLDTVDPSRLGTGARIIGTVSDDDGVDASTIQVRLDRNGDGDFGDANEAWVPVSNPSGDSIVSSWYHDISALAAASQGRKYVQLRALDIHAPAANLAEFSAFTDSASLTPSYNWFESPVVEFYIDYGPPTLSLSGPASGTRFNVNQFAVTGTTSDGNGVDRVTIWVDNDNDQVQDSGELSTIGWIDDDTDGIRDAGELRALGGSAATGPLTADDSPYSINYTITGLADGAKSVQVMSYDGADAASIRDFTVVIDTLAPTASFKTPTANNSTVNGSITVSGLANDSYQLSNVFYSVLAQGAPAPAYPAGYTALNESYSWDFDLDTLALGGNGTYVIRILPLDSAGNYPKSGSDPDPYTLNVIVDQASDKPVVDVLTIEEAGTAVANLLPGSLQISGTIRDDDGVEKTSVQLRSRLLPAGSWSSWAAISGPPDSNTTLVIWSHTFAGFTDGQYEFEMRAGDINDGGAYDTYSSGTTAAVKFAVDLSLPTATIAAPAASSYHKTDVAISGSASDASGIKSVTIAYDTGSGYGGEIALPDDNVAAGYTWSTSYAVDELTHLNDDQVFFRLTATDAFDKVRTYEQYFTVDTTAPSISFLQPSAPGTTLNGSVLLRGTATEANQLASVWFKVNNSTGPGVWATGTPSDNGWTLLTGTYSWDGRFKSTSLTPDVGATIYIMAIDGVGNRADPTLAANQLEFTPSLTANLPLLSFTTADNALLDNAGTITGTATDDDGVDASTLEISFDGGLTWRSVSSPGTDGLSVNWSHSVANGAGLAERALDYSVKVRVSDLGENFDGGDFTGLQDIAPVSGISSAISIKKDDAAPSAAVSSIDNGYKSSATLQGAYVSGTIKLAGSSSDGVGVSTVKARLVDVAGHDDFADTPVVNTGTSYSTWTWEKTSLVLAGSTVNFEVETTDVNGRSTTQSFTLLVDTSAPIVDFSTPALNPSTGSGAYNGSQIFRGSASDGVVVDKVYYRFGAANPGQPDAAFSGWTPAASPYSWATAALDTKAISADDSDFAYALWVLAVDSAGNVSAPASAAPYTPKSLGFTINQGSDKPAISIATPTAAQVLETNAKAQGSVTDDDGLASVAVRIDRNNSGTFGDFAGEAYVAVNSPASVSGTSLNFEHILSGLADGSYKLQLRARDTGYVDASTPYNETESAVLSFSKNTAAPTLALQRITVANRYGGADTVEADPAKFNGTYINNDFTLRLAASDLNGIKWWDHDSNGGTATVPYVSASADGSTWAPAADNGDGTYDVVMDIGDFGEGTGVVTFRAQDVDGKESSGILTVIVDTVAPAVAFATPSGISTDSGAEAPDLNGESVTVTGSVSDSNVIQTLTITGGTADAIDFTEGGTTSAWNISFDTTLYDDGGFATETGVGTGVWRLPIKVTAYDKAGNRVISTGYIDIDQSDDRPVIALSSPTSLQVLETNAKAQGSILDDDGIGAVEIRIDRDNSGVFGDFAGESYFAVTSGTSSTLTHDLSALADGAYKLQIRVKDSAYAAHSTTYHLAESAVISFYVDRQPPTLSLDKITIQDRYGGADHVNTTASSFNGSYVNNDFTLGFSAADANGIKLLDDDGDDANDDGFTDASGDLLAATPKVACVEVSLDNSSWSPFAFNAVNGTYDAPIAIASFPTDGTKVIYYRATDVNNKSSTGILTIIVDVAEPSIAFTSPSGIESDIGLEAPNVNGTAVVVTGTVSDASVITQLTIKGALGDLRTFVNQNVGNNQSWKISIDSTANDEGSYATETGVLSNVWRFPIKVTAMDNAGNITTAIGYIDLDPDGDKPVVTISTPAANVSVTGIIMLNGTVSDDDGSSGLVDIALDTDDDGAFDDEFYDDVPVTNGAWSQPINGTANLSGAVKFRVTPADANGKLGDAAERTIFVDSSLPSIVGTGGAIGSSPTPATGTRQKGTVTFYAAIKDDDTILNSQIQVSLNGGSAYIAVSSIPGSTIGSEYTIVEGGRSYKCKDISFPINTASYFLNNTGTGSMSVILQITDNTYKPAVVSLSYAVDNRPPEAFFDPTDTLAKQGGVYSFKANANDIYNKVIGRAIDSGAVSGIEYVDVYFVRPAGVFNLKNTTPGSISNALEDDGLYTQIAFLAADLSAGSDTLTIDRTGFGTVNNALPVRFAGTSFPGGVDANTLYYVGNVAGNSFKLYTDPALSSLVDISSAADGILEYAVYDVPYTNDVYTALNKAGTHYAIRIDRRTELGINDTNANGDGDGFQESLKDGGGYDEWFAYFNTGTIPDGPIDVYYVAYDQNGNKIINKAGAQIANNPPTIDSVEIDGSATLYSGLFKRANSLYFKVNASDVEGIDAGTYKATLTRRRTAPNGLDDATGSPAVGTVYDVANTGDGSAANDMTIAISGWESGVQYTLTLEVKDSHGNVATYPIDLWVNNSDGTPPRISTDDLSASIHRAVATGYIEEAGFSKNDGTPTSAAISSVAGDKKSAVFASLVGNGTIQVGWTLSFANGEWRTLTGFTSATGTATWETALAAVPTGSGSFQAGQADISGTLTLTGKAWDDTTIASIELSFDGGTTWVAATGFGQSGGDIIAGYDYIWTYTLNTALVDWNGATAGTPVVGLNKPVMVRANDGSNTGTLTKTGGNSTKTFDVVPYVKEIKRTTTGLKTNRTRFGSYSIYQGETAIQVLGFNLNPTGAGAAGLYKDAVRTGTADALTVSGVGAPYTSFNVAAQATTRSGWLGLSVTTDNGVTFIDAINNTNDNARDYNDDYGTDAQSEDWTDDRYFHVWKTGDYFGTATNQALNPEHPSMAIQPGSSRLIGAWANYGTNDAYFGTVNSDASPFRSRYYQTYDTAEYTDIDFDPANNNMSIGMLGNNSSDGTYGDGHIIAFTYEGTTYFDGAISPNVGDVANPNGGLGNNGARSPILASDARQWYRYNFDNWYYQGEGLGYDAMLYQFRQVKTVRRGNYNYVAYFDVQSNTVKFQSFDVTGTNEGELQNWINIDGATGDTDGGENGRQVGTGIGRTAQAGEFLALAVDEDNLPLIVYFDSVNQTLRLARASQANPATANWTRQEVLSAGDPLYGAIAGKHISAVVDDDGYLHISFWSDDTGYLYYVKSSNNPEGGAAYTFEASQVVDATGTAGIWSDITLDRSGATDKPYIAYLNSSRVNTKDGLKMAYYDSVKGGWEWVVAAANTTVVEKRVSVEYKRGGTPTWNAAIGYASPTRFELIYLMPQVP